VDPPTFHIPKYSSYTVTVTYSPSSIGEEESGRVKFVSPQLGEWLYLVSGSGQKPSVHPEDIIVSSTAGGSTSDSISFRNPFNETLEVQLDLRSSDSGARKSSFALLKKAKTSIPALAVVQLPFSFSPTEISEIRATLLVSCIERELLWTYNIRGISECPPPDSMLEFVCKTRTTKTFPLSLVLPGLRLGGSEESFTHELVVPDAKKQDVSRAVKLSMITPGGTLTSASAPLELELQLQPLKPFETSVQLIINKASGGRWRYLARIAAMEPDFDDTINIEASLHRTSNVAFTLANPLVQYAPFKASFSLDSGPEFAVFPTEGVLPPQGSPPLQFVISFTPHEYGKTSVAKLFIETDDMLWSFEVKGAPPEYHAPNVTTRIDNKMDAETLSRMASKAEHSKSRNIMRENMVVVKARSAPKAPGSVSSLGGSTRK